MACQATCVWKTPGSEFGSTHHKPTDDSGMSGHLRVEGAVIDFRVEDKECYGFLPDGETLVCHTEVGSQIATKKLDRISKWTASIQDILSVQETHETDLSFESRNLRSKMSSSDKETA